MLCIDILGYVWHCMRRIDMPRGWQAPVRPAERHCLRRADRSRPSPNPQAPNRRLVCPVAAEATDACGGRHARAACARAQMCLDGPTGGPLLPMRCTGGCARRASAAVSRTRILPNCFGRKRAAMMQVCAVRRQASPSLQRRQRRALAGLTGRLPFSLPRTVRCLCVCVCRRRLSV